MTHGESGYKHGCRCNVCRAGKAARARDRYHAQDPFERRRKRRARYEREQAEKQQDPRPYQRSLAYLCCEAADDPWDALWLAIEMTRRMEAA